MKSERGIEEKMETTIGEKTRRGGEG